MVGLYSFLIIYFVSVDVLLACGVFVAACLVYLFGGLFDRLVVAFV